MIENDKTLTLRIDLCNLFQEGEADKEIVSKEKESKSRKARIDFVVSPQLKERFKKACEYYETNMSFVGREIIRQ